MIGRLAKAGMAQLYARNGLGHCWGFEFELTNVRYREAASGIRIGEARSAPQTVNGLLDDVRLDP